VPSRKLDEYERKRTFERSPEPRGTGDRGARASGPASQGVDSGSVARGRPKRRRFVIHEHRARRLHWDLRLEHEGVAVSWALPRGVPDDPKRNRLAVHTEHHPLEYLDFEGEIPRGEYGAGTMRIWDRGTYDAEKFRDDEVILTFHGRRMKGRYALFRTRGDDWMIHRMDPPRGDRRDPMPERIEPMLATLVTDVPGDESAWAYEIKWDGVRAIAYCEAGRVRLQSRNLKDISAQWPEVRKLGEELGHRTAVLDGEICGFDEEGKPSFQRLQRRMHVKSASAIRRLAREIPATYVIFDLLYLDGRDLMGLPYAERRERLEELSLDGPAWQVPRNHRGDGRELLALTRERGLEGIVAKRLDSPYLPGKRGRAWLKIKNVHEQELVIGGWLPGQGRRESTLGALLVGYYDGGQLRYAGRVGTGFTEETLRMLLERLRPLEASDSPFAGRQPPREAVFVKPELVAQIGFSEWTQARTLRAPRFLGLREDKDPKDVVLEAPER